MEKLSFVPRVILTFCAATLLQLTMIWQLVVIAGIIAGMLARDIKTAVTGFLGLPLSWLFFLMILYLAAPVSFALASSFSTSLFAVGFILVTVLGLSSASVGYYSMLILEKGKSKGQT